MQYNYVKYFSLSFMMICCAAALFLNIDYGYSQTNENNAASKEYFAYYHLGMKYSLNKEYDKAIESFTKAILLNPEYYESYIDRGLSYLDNGQYDMAISDFDTALKFNPQYYMVYEGRAKANFKKNDFDKSWEDIHILQGVGFRINKNFLEELKQSSGREK